MPSIMKLGKYFFIKCQETHLVLEVEDSLDRPGTPVVTAAAKEEVTGNESQLWFLDVQSKTIRSKLNYFCLTDHENNIVVSPFLRGADKQKWHMADGRIQVEADFETVIGIPDEDVNTPGAQVCLMNDDGSAGTNFIFEHRPAHFFFIRSQQNEGKVLDVYKTERKPGGKIICWQDKGNMADNQLWYEDETGIIRSKLNEFAIDAGGKDLCLQPYDKNNHVQQWTVHGNQIQSRYKATDVIEYRPGKFGLALLSGDIAARAKYSGTQSQMWLFEPVPDSASSMNHTGLGKTFFIRSYISGLVLGLEGGETKPGTRLVTCYRQHDGQSASKKSEVKSNQLFFMDEATGTIRTLQNSNYCLDATDDKVALEAYDAYSKLQQWRVVGNKIQNRQERDVVFEVMEQEPEEGGHYEPGARVIISKDEGRESQWWEITHMPARYFFLVNIQDGNVLDIAKDEASAGAKVQLWKKKDVVCPNQLWYEDEKGIIRSRLNGYVIQADGRGACMMPYDPSNQDQAWVISGDRVQSKFKHNIVLDVKRRKTLIAYTFNGGDNQKWKQEYV